MEENAEPKNQISPLQPAASPADSSPAVLPVHHHQEGYRASRLAWLGNSLLPVVGPEAMEVLGGCWMRGWTTILFVVKKVLEVSLRCMQGLSTLAGLVSRGRPIADDFVSKHWNGNHRHTS
jgi:hypothetical protein